MAILAVTNSNLYFSKRALRKAYPDIKSSHLSEGIAAGLGYNTNAALLATAKDYRPNRPHIVKVDGERFGRRLEALGYAGNFENDITVVARSAQMPEPLWREFSSGEVHSQNSWFDECRRRNITFVHVSLRRSLAKLNWDHISLHADHDADLKSVDEGRQLGEKLYSAFCRRARSRKKALFFGSALVGSVDNLAADEARDLADEFVLTLETALQHYPPP